MGKVRSCKAQPSLSQIDPALDHREARANLHSSILSSKWTYWCATSLDRGHICEHNHFLEVRLRQELRQEEPISTMRFIQKTTVISLSTSTLGLNLAISRACRLSGNSSHTGLTRAVQLLKNYTPFGRVLILKLLRSLSG